MPNYNTRILIRLYMVFYHDLIQCVEFESGLLKVAFWLKNVWTTQFNREIYNNPYLCTVTTSDRGSSTNTSSTH